MESAEMNKSGLQVDFVISLQVDNLTRLEKAQFNNQVIRCFTGCSALNEQVVDGCATLSCVEEEGRSLHTTRFIQDCNSCSYTLCRSEDTTGCNTVSDGALTPVWSKREHQLRKSG